MMFNTYMFTHASQDFDQHTFFSNTPTICNDSMSSSKCLFISSTCT